MNNDDIPNGAGANLHEIGASILASMSGASQDQGARESHDPNFDWTEAAAAVLASLSGSLHAEEQAAADPAAQHVQNTVSAPHPVGNVMQLPNAVLYRTDQHNPAGQIAQPLAYAPPPIPGEGAPYNLHDARVINPGFTGHFTHASMPALAPTIQHEGMYLPASLTAPFVPQHPSSPPSSGIMGRLSYDPAAPVSSAGKHKGGGKNAKGGKGKGKGDDDVANSNVRLNKQITNCRKFDALLALIAKHVEEFDAVNASTALHHLAKNFIREAKAASHMYLLTVLLPLFRRMMILVQSTSFGAQCVANTLWSIAKIWGGEKLGLAEEILALVSRLVDTALQQATTFRAQNVSNTLWSLAKLGPGCVDAVTLQKLINRFCDRFLKTSTDFNAQNVANSLWALGKLGARHVPFVMALLDRAKALLSDEQFSPQHLANTVWALAKLNVPNPEFLKQWDVNACAQVSQFIPQDMVNCMWALAKLGIQRDVILWSLLLAKVPQHASAFSGQHLATALWAIADLPVETLDTKTFSLYPVLFRRIPQACGGLSASDVAHVLFAAARCRETEEILNADLSLNEILQEAVAAVCRRGLQIPLADWTVSPFAHATWALCKMRVLWAESPSSVGYQYVKLLVTTLVNNVKVSILADCDVKCLSMVAVGLALFGRNHSLVFFRTISDTAVASLANFTPRALASLVWAFATVEMFDVQLFSCVAKRFESSDFKDCLGQEWVDVANAMWPIRHAVTSWAFISHQVLMRVYVPITSEIVKLAKHPDGESLKTLLRAEFPATVPSAISLGTHYTREAIADLGLHDGPIPETLRHIEMRSTSRFRLTQDFQKDQEESGDEKGGPKEDNFPKQAILELYGEGGELIKRFVFSSDSVLPEEASDHAAAELALFPSRTPLVEIRALTVALRCVLDSRAARPAYSPDVGPPVKEVRMGMSDVPSVSSIVGFMRFRNVLPDCRIVVDFCDAWDSRPPIQYAAVDAWEVAGAGTRHVNGLYVPWKAVNPGQTPTVSGSGLYMFGATVYRQRRRKDSDMPGWTCNCLLRWREGDGFVWYISDLGAGFEPGSDENVDLYVAMEPGGADAAEPRPPLTGWRAVHGVGTDPAPVLVKKEVWLCQNVGDETRNV